jgi:hypothetical protein
VSSLPTPPRLLLSTLALGLTVLGCGGGGGGGGGGSTQAASTGGGGGSALDPAAWPHPPAARMVESGSFATASVCWNCHATDSGGGMQDAAGRDVSPYGLWQATMMANAVRDPLYRAEVSVEIAATPSLASAIEAKCLRCHAPMAVEDAAQSGVAFRFAELEQNTDRAQLALDGVSCSLCHQIEDAPDASATFSGAFTLNDRREIYGPHDNPDYRPMTFRTNYLPMQADHVSSSNLCASCHTLHTDAYAADGTPTGGRLPEQTPFLEWQNSVFNDQVANPGPDAASCQACHTPSTDVDGNPIQTQIARADLGTQVRSSYGRHAFVGGNSLIPRILRDEAADLKPIADAAAFDAVIAATRDQLAQRTARLTLGSINRAGDDLLVPVTVENLTGHKFPTGHPVRRAWLRVRVTDAQGQVVFASGEHDAAGRLIAGAAVLPSERVGGPHQPHRPLIDRPEQVQVYQSLMADGAGKLTFLLLRGEGYLKDNRLLPRGWSPLHPAAADTAPQGLGSDGDFVGGSDQVLYRVAAPAARGPYRVEATLLYQALSARFAAELFAYDTPEVEAFRVYYERADRRPDLVASASASAN